jgi:hypothetical protein
MTEFGSHPRRLDLDVHAGDPVDVAIPVLDGAGAAVSLSGWTATARALDPGGSVLWDFSPTIVSDQIRVAATAAQTRTWAWQPYAARLVVSATPPAGAAMPITNGWIRFYLY